MGEGLLIKRWLFSVFSNKYILYALPNPDDSDYMDYWLEKKDYGAMHFCIGVNWKELKLTEENEDQFISNNITDWLAEYSEMMCKLEDEYYPNEP